MEGGLNSGYIVIGGTSAYYDELVTAETRTYHSILATFRYNCGKAFKGEISFFVAEVVVDELQTIHIDKGYKQLFAACLAAFEQSIGRTDEAVAVIDIAQGINDIKSVQLVYYAAQVEQLAYILHGVAYIQDR